MCCLLARSLTQPESTAHKLCAGRESNPDLLFGTQPCLPLHHRRCQLRVGQMPAKCSRMLPRRAALCVLSGRVGGAGAKCSIEFEASRLESTRIARAAASTALMRPVRTTTAVTGVGTDCVSVNQQLHIFDMPRLHSRAWLACSMRHAACGMALGQLDVRGLPCG